MIGDDLIADIADIVGGCGAGLRAIWIDRGTWPDQEHDAQGRLHRPMVQPHRDLHRFTGSSSAPSRL
ncbi:hypothetical protein ACQP25_29520 [Microtetraspora malaysiensis]|uniref:hypothetical protein n=1 Tax=Microtetraspora malaysiensis TaxID=161358 RepID=UPI003D8AA8EA